MSWNKDNTNKKHIKMNLRYVLFAHM